ncbi:MAG: hypothetical protein LC112_03920 [Flavobacteriales bacterium]|nr:hypothetical protein [Flavobacteriales bacterium]
MIKNNPFITIFLLFFIEVVLYIYIDYLNIFSADSEDLVLIISFFTIPVIAILMRIFLVEEPYKRSFKYFTIFLVIASIIGFSVLSFLGALAKAYQH